MCHHRLFNFYPDLFFFFLLLVVYIKLFNYHYNNIIYNGWKIKSIASRPNIEPIALVSWIFIENQSPCISLLSWSRKLNVHRSSHCCNYLYWQDRCPQINASLKIWFTFNTQKRKHLDHKYWRNQQYRK